MILITGGAGFIGSNIAADFHDQNYDIAICDWLGNSDKWKNIQKLVPKDIIAPEALPRWLERRGNEIDAVIHMGAISATTETDADLILENNFRLSVSLWHYCATFDIPFIYASSAATYGDGSSGFSDDTGAKNMASLMPLNPYGWSKHLFDRWVLAQIQRGAPQPAKWAGLKFFNVYGPNEYHKGSMKSVIAQNYSRIAAGEAIKLFKSYHPDYADGGQIRDFIYVRDCINVVTWMLENNFESGIYNLGTGRARSWNDLAAAIFATLGLDPKIEYIEMPEELRGRYQYFTEADMDKLKSAGCPINFHSLEDGVADYVQSHLSQENQYR